MRHLLKFALAAFCVTALPACKNKEKERRRNDLVGLMHGTTPDPAISEAMAKAQATVGEFLTAVQKAEPGTKDFTVRKIFPAKDAKQQILQVTNVTYDGKNLSGQVRDNTARPGSGVPMEGTVSFPPSEVVDWMYLKDQNVIGAFMLRALKTKMTPEEWAGYERQFSDRGLKFVD